MLQRLRACEVAVNVFGYGAVAPIDVNNFVGLEGDAYFEIGRASWRERVSINV